MFKTPAAHSLRMRAFATAARIDRSALGRAESP